jgi:hypothetical protein
MVNAAGTTIFLWPNIDDSQRSGRSGNISAFPSAGGSLRAGVLQVFGLPARPPPCLASAFGGAFVVLWRLLMGWPVKSFPILDLGARAPRC